MLSSSGAMFAIQFIFISTEIELIAAKLRLDSRTSLVGQARHNNFLSKIAYILDTEFTSLKYLDKPNKKSVCMKYIGISKETIQPLMEFKKYTPTWIIASN
jgi:hypothetical protein